MTETRTVWGIGTPRTLRPQWALIELGLDYEHKKVLPRGTGMEDPELLAISHRHKVPFYADDRVQMGESAAIVSYLSERYGDEERLPMPASGTAERALVHDRVLFVMTEIDARMYNLQLHADPPLGLSQIYGAASEAVKAAKKYAYREFEEATRWLSDGRRFVVGDQFGVTDILLTSCIDWAKDWNVNFPEPLIDYRNRVAERPSYKTAIASNAPSNAST